MRGYLAINTEILSHTSRKLNCSDSLSTELNEALLFCQTKHSSIDEKDSRSGVPDTFQEPVYREVPEDNIITRNKMAFKLKNKKSLSKYRYGGRYGGR